MALVLKSYPSKAGVTTLLSVLISEQKTPNASIMLPWNSDGRDRWAVTEKAYFFKTWQIRAVIGKLDERDGIEILDLITSQPAPATKAGSAQTAKSGPNSGSGDNYQLSCCGDYWQITFRGKERLVKNLIGLRYIALLIRDADRNRPPMHVRALVDLEKGRPLSSAGPESAPDLKLASEAKDIENVLDDDAQDNYEKRRKKIQEEMASASAAGNIAKQLELAAEDEQILEELRRWTSRKGSNSFITINERARKSVGNAITDAIRKISATGGLEDLAEHLKTNIKKGKFLSYQGTLDWTVTLDVKGAVKGRSR